MKDKKRCGQKAIAKDLRRDKFIISKTILIIIFLISFFITSIYLNLPSDIKLRKGNQKYVSLAFGLRLETDINKLKSCSITKVPETKGAYLVEGNKLGTDSVKAVLGFIPIKKVTVKIVPDTKLVPLGKICGIKIWEDGVLVLKDGDIKSFNKTYPSPSKDLILEGDIISEINGVKVKNKDELVSLVNENANKECRVRVIRDKKTIDVVVTPIKENITDSYKLGLWVRDSTQGIGTMTYYDKKTGKIGMLGHAICDVDTGKLFNVRCGTLNRADITCIKKGKKKEPGEVVGIIYQGNDFKQADIIKNTKSGIVAKIDKDLKKEVDNLIEYPISLKGEVKLGKAFALSDIESNGPKAYEVEIEEINKYGNFGSDGIIIRVTDEKLIEKTGGIVQGMSGSPIIQDGKIIGAITHVFVEDPTKGFGIFIEDMLEEE